MYKPDKNHAWRDRKHEDSNLMGKKSIQLTQPFNCDKFQNMFLAYPIKANAINSSTSKGKSSLKFVLNRAVTVSANKMKNFH